MEKSYTFLEIKYYLVVVVAVDFFLISSKNYSLWGPCQEVNGLEKKSAFILWWQLKQLQFIYDYSKWYLSF